MNLKRWFAWACLALMLLAEALLFVALRQKDAMSTRLQETRTQLWQMNRELQALRHSDAGLQHSEILRLRKRSEIYSNEIARLRSDFMVSTQQLAVARTALQLQQDHLAQLQDENRIVTDAGVSIIQRNTCINNLREIDGAKQEWALEHDMPMDAVPTVKDLLPYLKGGVFPKCPAGGKYSINSVEKLPTCSIPGHVLPQ